MKSLKLYPAWFFLGFIMAIATAVYAAKVITPINNQTPTSIAGADADGNIVPIRTNPSGNLSIQDSFGTTRHGTITVTGNGATDRVQGPDLSVNSCSFKAYATNAGRVYLGGSTVTNASGASQGLDLSLGEPLSNRTMSNLNTLYFAADTANDKIHYLCN